MIKLIASDIDGTLVPDGTDKIDPRMMDVIKRCRRNGIYFAGASGRQFASMYRLFAPVAEDIFYITDNGSILRSYKEVLSMKVIDKKDLWKMVKDAKKIPRSDIMLCGREWAYCEDEGEMFYWLRDSYKFNVKVVGDFEEHLTDDISKMSIYRTGDCEEAVNEEFTPKWEKKFLIASAGTMWMDIVLPDADKGTSLRKLQEHLGVTPAETMVFGDNLNDIGMLQASEESYAIGSARDEVKAAAKHIAPPLSEYGETTVITDYLDSIGAE